MALQGERNDFQNIEQEARSILKDAGIHYPHYVSIRRQADLTPPSAEDTHFSSSSPRI